ncbi:MAG: class I SAM-dependent methyltransferase [Desulfobacteraceae bacterium]|nr:MAG: class I SAM-dependent methyltransferase [Desulfobacteraceae bacterium]
MTNVAPEGGFRTAAEDAAGRKIAAVFDQCPESIEVKLDHFTKYIRRQRLTRLLALYEIFKRILAVKGSIVECGVYHGFGIMAWANISAVLEPANLTRRIYGFDTFEGFPDVGAKDSNLMLKAEKGHLYSNSFEELKTLIDIYDSNRFLGHVSKVQLVKGDVKKTVPEFIADHKHLLVSLLFLDLDLYEPTKVAIDYFLPRMPKGAVIAFDELDNPIWPGETAALLETVGIQRLRIERIEFDPYIGFAVMD